MAVSRDLNLEIHRDKC